MYSFGGVATAGDAATGCVLAAPPCIEGARANNSSYALSLVGIIGCPDKAGAGCNGDI